MAQWLRALAALPEDLSSSRQTSTVAPVPGDPMPCGLCGHYECIWCIYIFMQTKHPFTETKNKSFEKNPKMSGRWTPENASECRSVIKTTRVFRMTGLHIHFNSFFIFNNSAICKIKVLNFWFSFFLLQFFPKSGSFLNT